MNSNITLPYIKKIHCAYCGTVLKKCRFFFQGIHLCNQAQCDQCQQTVIADLPIGQAAFTPYQVHLESKQLYGDARSRNWFGEPFLYSLLHPSNRDVELEIDIKKKNIKKVVFLNCLDYLYGHSLLKLFNLSIHLRKKEQVVVLCQKNLRWLVPDSVAEVWTVDIPFSRMQEFYPSLHKRVERELSRFEKVELAPAHSHPLYPNIPLHTGYQPHRFSDKKYRITFIVRDDRLWVDPIAPQRFPFLRNLQRIWQYLKILQLFGLLRNKFPDAQFTVAGMGEQVYWLPRWIDQQLFQQINMDIEKQLCQVYTESRVVIGVHGSNMLLPSALAGAVVDLMPPDRWGNFAQDIVYREGEDPRVTSFLRRYLPIKIMIPNLMTIISSVINDHETVLQLYTSE